MTFNSLTGDFAPGAIVRHPDRPDWGDGMVQSAIGHRVTVNFPNAGKQMIDTSVIALVLVSHDNRA